MKLAKSLARGFVALILAAAIWLPCVHFLFAHNDKYFREVNGLSPVAMQLAARHLQLWTDPNLKERELSRMRRTNAEWDFMGRTFLVWSLADMGLRNPAAKADYLKVMDEIIGETIRLERERGMYFFLMPYAKGQPYVRQPAHSIFLDGEIAMMIASRRLLEEKADYREPLRERIEGMQERMRLGRVMSAESYPDECWVFDNVVALAAMRMADRLDGSNHAAFIREWLTLAKQKLTDPHTGILISSFTEKGEALDGPEGSSIWMTTHCLRLLDEDFARDQYQRARTQLSRGVVGFAWSREWPVSWRGQMDVDSGPVIPGLEVSAGASGMALIAASSFEDKTYLSALVTTLDFAAFPSRKDGRLKYCASNQVGDAALLYATVLGPLWAKVEGVKP